MIKISYISCATIRGRADSSLLKMGRGEGEPNLINRGGNEKKAIASASSLRCLGFGRQKWSENTLNMGGGMGSRNYGTCFVWNMERDGFSRTIFQNTKFDATGSLALSSVWWSEKGELYFPTLVRLYPPFYSFTNDDSVSFASDLMAQDKSRLRTSIKRSK